MQNKRSKPKLAVWKFSSCDGCQLSLLDCEDELLAPDTVNALGIVGRGDGAFYQRKVIRAFDHRARGFWKIGNLHRVSDREQFILAIQQAQLATVTGRELPYCQLRFVSFVLQPTPSPSLPPTLTQLSENKEQASRSQRKLQNPNGLHVGI